MDNLGIDKPHSATIFALCLLHKGRRKEIIDHLLTRIASCKCAIISMRTFLAISLSNLNFNDMSTDVNITISYEQVFNQVIVQAESG